MLRVINSSNRSIVQRIVRSTLSIARAQSSTDAEAGSVASGNDSFSKKEHAEETRWARRRDAEKMAKLRTEQGGAGKGTPQQRIAALEAEKKKIEQEIEQLKRGQS